MPIFSNAKAMGAFILIAVMGWGCDQYPAHVELDAADQVVMTRAELMAHDKEIRIRAAREAFSAKECGWREFLTEQPRKGS